MLVKLRCSKAGMVTVLTYGYGAYALSGMVTVLTLFQLWLRCLRSFRYGYGAYALSIEYLYPVFELQLCNEMLLCIVFNRVFILLSRESNQRDITSSLRSCRPSVHHTKMGKLVKCLSLRHNK